MSLTVAHGARTSKTPSAAVNGRSARHAPRRPLRPWPPFPPDAMPVAGCGMRNRVWLRTAPMKKLTVRQFQSDPGHQ